MSCYL